VAFPNQAGIAGLRDARPGVDEGRVPGPAIGAHHPHALAGQPQGCLPPEAAAARDILRIAETCDERTLVLMLVSLFMTPKLVEWVAERRFPLLERKQGGHWWQALAWALGSTLIALVVLVLSIPLWFIPPLVLVVPPLVWGWLTYRVMAFDALAEHASQAERQAVLTRFRMPLLGMGVVCGVMGAAPSVVWASGVVFVALFWLLVPLAIWIYALVFALSSLWFAHFCLAALEQLRREAVTQGAAPDAVRVP